MNLSARLVGIEQLFGRLTKLGDALAGPAVSASTDALAQEIERARDAEGFDAPLVREQSARRSSLGVSDPAAIAQELGTLDQAPAPWLAPATQAARGPVRATVSSAVARTLSSLRTAR